ncbi:hypothetical protein KC726_05785 [Candidatus Woesebacteria bacterium]|nr:hypothetical protein [Candidatus Woesebacteria bacterium]
MHSWNDLLPRVKIGAAMLLAFFCTTMFAPVPNLYVQHVVLKERFSTIQEQIMQMSSSISQLQAYLPENNLAFIVPFFTNKSTQTIQQASGNQSGELTFPTGSGNVPTTSNSTSPPSSSPSQGKNLPSVTPTSANIMAPTNTQSPKATNTPFPTATRKPNPTATQVPVKNVQPINCPSTSSRSYGTISIVGSPETRNVATHPDINLDVRGYAPVNEAKQHIRIYTPLEPVDPPQLTTLGNFTSLPPIVGTYRANHWDWNNNARGPAITVPVVTVIGIGMNPGDLLHTPVSGYDIGGGKEVMVLFATQTKLTIKYTREDNMAYGYGLHFDDICVDPNLVALYNQMNSQGRHILPALSEGEVFGVARTGEVKVAVRDTGAFQDLREIDNWWEAFL